MWRGHSSVRRGGTGRGHGGGCGGHWRGLGDHAPRANRNARNAKRRSEAAVAAAYQRAKIQKWAARKKMAEKILALRQQSGFGAVTIERELAGSAVAVEAGCNKRFIERTLY